MDGLISAIPLLHGALTAARRDDLGRIDEALLRFGVTGVHGEAEVGITRLIEAAIARAEHPCIRVDLDGATSDTDVAWLLARGLARVILGPALSMVLLPPGLRPASADRHFIQFAEAAGRRVADLSVSEQATAPDMPVPEVLDAVGRVYEQSVQSPALWIDHLQAPTLTPRHPLDVDALLWNVRTIQQKFEMPVIVSGHRTATPVAYGKRGAFHGDGLWVSIGRPGLAVWLDAADALGASAPTPGWTVAMAEITHGHPATTLLALALSAEFAARRPDPLHLWRFMLSSDDGHVARAILHARTLHRLGGRVLEQIAQGAGPYEDAPSDQRRKEIHRAVTRLHEGGLITQPRPRTWEVTNPLVAGRLRREAPSSIYDASPCDPREHEPTGV